MKHGKCKREEFLGNGLIIKSEGPRGTELTLEDGQYEGDALLRIDDIDRYPCSHDESIVHCHAPAPPCPEASRGQVVVQNAPHLQCTGAQIPFCRL